MTSAKGMDDAQDQHDSRVVCAFAVVQMACSPRQGAGVQDQSGLTHSFQGFRWAAGIPSLALLRRAIVQKLHTRLITICFFVERLSFQQDSFF